MNNVYIIRFVLIQNSHSYSNGGFVCFENRETNLLIEESTFFGVSSEKEGGVIFVNCSSHVLVRNCLFKRCFSSILTANQGGNVMRLIKCLFTYQSSSIFRCHFSDDDPGDAPIRGRITTAQLSLNNFSQNYAYNKPLLSGSTSTELACETGDVDHSIFEGGKGFRVIEFDCDSKVSRCVFVQNKASYIFTCECKLNITNCYLYNNDCKLSQPVGIVNFHNCFGDVSSIGIDSVPMSISNIQPIGYYRIMRTSKLHKMVKSLSTFAFLLSLKYGCREIVWI